MNTGEIRQLFTGFFGQRGHRAIPSSSLIPPPEERTLLFTNAGMNQMKPYFMGMSEPPATRMTSIQKCVRTGDIEEVGDNRHLTFFEMLGNFSVGDYFKAEVIPWAWELLTAPRPQGLGLDKERIWATIFDDDEESFELWRSVGLPPERIVRYGEEFNYWFMIKGGAGPCGPNTEINYDFGPYEGWEPHACHPQCEVPGCRRFMELWNLVFMTLFQEADGSRRPLPKRNVDTGGGLERWPTAVLWERGIDWQGKPKRWTAPPTIWDTDLFREGLTRIGELAGRPYDAAGEDEQVTMRVIADHARSATFLIADGVTPSNDGRGYVLRRLIRRAMYFGAGFSVKLGPVVEGIVDQMSPYYPELVERRAIILRLIDDEERRFGETMHRGGNELDAEITQLLAQGKTVILGQRAFYFAATLGFPIELTREIAERRGLQIDREGYESEMERHREISGVGTHFEGDSERVQTYSELGLPSTLFLGYETTRLIAGVSAIVLDGNTPVQALSAAQAEGHRIEVVLDQTPFYAEGGGQVGDRGELVSRDGEVRFKVEDTQAVGEGGLTAHVGRLESGTLRVGEAVEACVDESLRGDTMRNHTATHILHASLRRVLGGHVRQAGSLVTPDRLRFDFTHLEGLSADELRRVEALANEAVRNNLEVHEEHQSYEDAIAGGALAFFGDKYADTVRVIGVCDPEADACFSKELCGGTHVHASGDVGAIVITSESSIGAGLRRLEAVTGRAAAERIRQGEDTLGRLAAGLRVRPEEVEGRVSAMRARIDELEKQVQATERRLARSLVEAASSDSDDVETIGGVAVAVRRVEVPSGDALRTVGDGLRGRLGESVVLLGAVIDGRPAFLAMATESAARRCPAGDVVRAAAQAAGGNGGGRPQMAQGGGADASKLDEALAAGKKLIESKLGATA